MANYCHDRDMLVWEIKGTYLFSWLTIYLAKGIEMAKVDGFQAEPCDAGPQTNVLAREVRRTCWRWGSVRSQMPLNERAEAIP